MLPTRGAAASGLEQPNTPNAWLRDPLLSSPPTNLRSPLRCTRREEYTPGTDPPSFPSFSPAADELPQPLQLDLAQYPGVHHSAYKLFHRTLAEPVDDLSHSASRQASRRFHRQVDISPRFLAVRQIAFLLQSSQDGTDGRFLETPRAGDHLMNRLHRRISRIPNDAHHFVFEIRQRRTYLRATERTLWHGTCCTISNRDVQSIS